MYLQQSNKFGFLSLFLLLGQGVTTLKAGATYPKGCTIVFPVRACLSFTRERNKNKVKRAFFFLSPVFNALPIEAELMLQITLLATILPATKRS